jgi:hypothetical protein
MGGGMTCKAGDGRFDSCFLSTNALAPFKPVRVYASESRAAESTRGIRCYPACASSARVRRSPFPNLRNCASAHAMTHLGGDHRRRDVPSSRAAIVSLLCASRLRIWSDVPWRVLIPSSSFCSRPGSLLSCTCESSSSFFRRSISASCGRGASLPSVAIDENNDEIPPDSREDRPTGVDDMIDRTCSTSDPSHRRSVSPLVVLRVRLKKHASIRVISFT